MKSTVVCVAALVAWSMGPAAAAPPDPPAGPAADAAPGGASAVAEAAPAPSTGEASPQGGAVARSEHPTLGAGASIFVLGAGIVEVLDPDREGFLSIEYRYVAGRRTISPWLVVEATDHDQFAGFGGFYDVPVGRRWTFTPSFGASIYSDRHGLGLGYHLEFRSTGEMTAKVGRSRVGASFGHYSNGRLSRTNPGTEVFKFLWILPIGRNAHP